MQRHSSDSGSPEKRQCVDAPLQSGLHADCPTPQHTTVERSIDGLLACKLALCEFSPHTRSPREGWLVRSQELFTCDRCSEQCCTECATRQCVPCAAGVPYDIEECSQLVFRCGYAAYGEAWGNPAMVRSESSFQLDPLARLCWKCVTECSSSECSARACNDHMPRCENCLAPCCINCLTQDLIEFEMRCADCLTRCDDCSGISGSLEVIYEGNESAT